MAKFLNTSATNYFLEELIKATRERLIIISPFLKFNDRIRELLQDKDRMKIDVRIVYGKSELAPHEINWLRSLPFVRTSFCQNLHAKCYLNERSAIITSMNLYDFSQVNNNEMGVFVDREQEPDLYRETYEEAQRLIRVSEEVRLAAEKVDPPKDEVRESTAESADEKDFDKLTTSRLAKALGMRTGELGDKLL
ncbi:phospholipase D family protein, partial [uncultured Lamprocystis sp.]